MQAGLSTKNAPSPSVVLPHFVFGAISFFVAGIVMMLYASDLVLPFHLNAKILVLTHVMVLGFITMMIFGALYQLIPVVMEVKLYSEVLAKISFYLFSSGTILLVISFWEATFDNAQNWLWFEIAGTLILIAVILFAINILKSAAKTERKDIGNKFIVTAIIYLLLTVSLAITMIINFAHTFIPVSTIDLLKMHAHLGLVGWFLFLIIGVASKLMPMFLITNKMPIKLLNYSYYLLNTGIILLVLVLSFYPEQWAIGLSGVFIIAGVLLFLLFNRYAFKHRFRKKLDVGLQLSKIAFIILAIVLVFGLISLVVPGFSGLLQIRIEIAYGMSIVLGFLTALILGQSYKTLPFIVWLKNYQTKIGRQKIPLPQELYSTRVANFHRQTFVVAFVMLIAGEIAGWVWLLQAAAVMYIITAILYNYNIFKIVFHKATKF